jgi:sodium-dependent dicarboxylate transporter 2/3/5
MLYGVPIAVAGIAIVWTYVVKAFIPPRMSSILGGISVVDDELEQLGAMSREERFVLVVFVAAAVAWVSRSLVDPFAAIVTDDSIIAIAAGLVLFLIPAREADGSRTTLLDWATAVSIPWGVLLLFGGGLTIAAGFESTGLAQWIGGLLTAFQGVSILLIIGTIVVLTVFLTEVTSNTATTAMLMPILASLAVGLSLHPYAVMIGAATAASFAFMLPVATPPNAIVFGSGYITIPQMAKTGAGLNLIGIILITLLTLSWLPLIWGIDVTRLPQWAGLLVPF